MEMSEKKRRAQKLLEVVPKGTLLRMLFARLTDETAAVFTRQAIRAELRTATLEAQEAGDTAERMARLDAQGTEIPLQELTDAKRDLRLKLAKLQRLEQAMAVIERLEEIYRVTLMLHYQDGWSIQKIADYMGVPVKTAQKRLERARAKVWREVEKYDAGIADPL